MKKLIGSLSLMLAALAVAGAAFAAEGEMVVSPAKRQEILDQAKNLLAAKNPVAIGKDPFHSETPVEAPPVPTGEATPAKAVVQAGPRSARDLLQAIATSPSLKPSGFFVLGGQPTLVFSQKRVKAGGTLTITFEGTEYALEIVSITPPNFTLRLNREEFTRPIK